MPPDRTIPSNEEPYFFTSLTKIIGVYEELL
ncbi:hypothetical protein MAN88_10020 [Microcystis aeruginosa]|nr:hypothetical protein MAN88_10020 [Microcystis aeruginosa]